MGWDGMHDASCVRQHIPDLTKLIGRGWGQVAVPHDPPRPALLRDDARLLLQGMWVWIHPACWST